VSTISTPLYKQLLRDPEAKLNTQILTEVAWAVSKVKTLIGWLDRYPFQGNIQIQLMLLRSNAFSSNLGHHPYSELRKQMLKLGLELATSAQRDRFVQNPVEQIMMLAKRLSELSDYIIQDVKDPMLLQPTYLDLVTLKKRESDLGFYVMPSYQFIHR
jgi:connector enhancer of kinase suppressor of Ras 2